MSHSKLPIRISIAWSRQTAPPQTTKTADPSDYLAKLPTLAPGERLLLEPGTYPSGLPINGLNGALIGVNGRYAQSSAQSGTERAASRKSPFKPNPGCAC